MKKIILILLLAIPFCKAADPYKSWYQVTKDIPDLQEAKVLRLCKKQLETIPDLDLSQLKKLILRHNKLTTIGKLNCPQLVLLNLGNNELAAIPDIYLPGLRTLYLVDNYIGTINPEKVLQNFPKLCSIFLNRNPLTHAEVNGLIGAAAREGRKIKINAHDTDEIKYRNPSLGANKKGLQSLQ